MIAIRNYNNTLIELNSAKNRLGLLEAEASKIFDRFFPTTANLESEMTKGMTKADKQAEYQIEMDRIRKHTGLSLRDEIQEAKNDVSKLEYYLNLMENDLKNFVGIEYDLYYAIVIDKNNAHKSISKIIEKMAEEHEKHPNTMWNHYYDIKKYLKKLEYCDEIVVNDDL